MAQLLTERKTGPQLENNLTQEIEESLENWLDPTLTGNCLLPNEYRRATRTEDLRLGTDFFLFDIPIDITEKPISDKDHAEDLHHTMSFLDNGDEILVDFGVRYGNSYKGFVRFNRQVLTLSVRDYNEELARLNGERMIGKRSRKEIAGAFGRHLDDIVFIGKYLYDNSVRKPKSLMVLVTDENTGALYTGQGWESFRRRASLKTGVPEKDIELYPGVNPHIDIVREVMESSNIMVYAIDKRPNNSSGSLGYVYNLTPEEVADGLAKFAEAGRGDATVWDMVVEENL